MSLETGHSRQIGTEAVPSRPWHRAPATQRAAGPGLAVSATGSGWAAPTAAHAGPRPVQDRAPRSSCRQDSLLVSPRGRRDRGNAAAVQAREGCSEHGRRMWPPFTTLRTEACSNHPRTAHPSYARPRIRTPVSVQMDGDREETQRSEQGPGRCGREYGRRGSYGSACRPPGPRRLCWVVGHRASGPPRFGAPAWAAAGLGSCRAKGTVRTEATRETGTGCVDFGTAAKPCLHVLGAGGSKAVGGAPRATSHSRRFTHRAQRRGQIPGTALLRPPSVPCACAHGGAVWAEGGAPHTACDSLLPRVPRS